MIACKRDVLPNSGVFPLYLLTSEETEAAVCDDNTSGILCMYITSKQWISADQLQTNSGVMRAKSELQGSVTA